MRSSTLGEECMVNNFIFHLLDLMAGAKVDWRSELDDKEMTQYVHCDSTWAAILCLLGQISVLLAMLETIKYWSLLKKAR